MGSPTALDSDAIWRRLGLEELRKALAKVQQLMKRFEQAVGDLPPCTQCARARLLEQVRAASQQLVGELLSVQVLTETLKSAVASAEQVHAALIEHAPVPCRCRADVCTCHD